MKMDNAPVHIVVDDREKEGGKVLAALAASDDATVEIARLAVGDYHIEHRVVVERKTAADFAASLIDGRLFHQAAALALAPERAARLLERFGSVRAIMTASADDLATVDGIGEKTAAKMRWVLGEPAAEFGTPPHVP